MKKLSIIIPYHNEPEVRIALMFRSLNEQDGVDWNDIEIIVTNDHVSPKNMTDFFNSFDNIKDVIRYLECPVHVGPGPNRQFAIDNCFGEYVSFLDADDMLLDHESLNYMIESIRSGADVYISDEVVEIFNDTLGLFDRGLSPSKNMFVHGKIIKKRFLIDNKIRFNSKVVVFEDTLFMTLVKSHSNFTTEVIDPFYVYRFNNNSISRQLGRTKLTEKEIHHWIVLSPRTIESLQSLPNIEKTTIIKFYFNWLLDRYDNYANYSNSVGESELINQIGYLVKQVDPTLKLALTINTDTKNDIPYQDWLKSMVKKCDVEKTKLKYGFEDLCIHPYIVD